MKNLKESIKKIVREFVIQKSTSFKITEIKYFSPSGRKNVPNGHIMQKGGFIKECIDNSKKFKTENYQFLINEVLEFVESIHDQQYGLWDYRGGIITFSTDVNSLDISDIKIFNWFKKNIKVLSISFFQNQNSIR